MAAHVQIEALGAVPIARRQVEIVERKGLGHPDTICDEIAEAVSRRLCHAYLELAGHVLHHNVDKALLLAGSSEPAFGGGRLTSPMRLILGGRATSVLEGRSLPVADLAVDTAATWLREHLRFVDPPRHVRIESAIRPGSAQLVDVFSRETAVANDTSVGVGYAPLSETEQLVLTAERALRTPAFQERFPELGEDVKVMGVRTGRALELTLAIAFVDRFVPGEARYFERKHELTEVLRTRLSGGLQTLDRLDVRINALDRAGRGADGTYLTVLGTSAEGADSGEVGRGNRVNGLIPFQRPHSMEAAAGKNPVRHVGKIYNLLATDIAARVHERVPGLEEVHVYLCSRIGAPVAEPWMASAQLGLGPGLQLGDVQAVAREVFEQELADIPAFIERIVRDGLPVC